MSYEGMPGMVPLFGVPWYFDDCRRAEAIQKGIDEGDNDILDKLEPGAKSAFIQAQHEYGQKRMVIGKIVVKDRALRPYPPEQYFDPMPFEFFVAF